MINLLYEELSYQIRGAAYAVKKKYGLGHKEVLYQRALAEEFDNRKIKYKREPKIKIYSPDTGKTMCFYQPDFLADNKIIVELKAKVFIPKNDRDRMYSYLRNSEYELGFFINYGSEDVEIKRIIYSNNGKGWHKAQIKQGVAGVGVRVSPCLPRTSVSELRGSSPRKSA